MSEETIKVYDRYGFYYEVQVEHEPSKGFSMAYYQGRIIADVEYGTLREPLTDDDLQWERYEEALTEWCENAIHDLKPKCVEYLNSLNP